MIINSIAISNLLFDRDVDINLSTDHGSDHCVKKKFRCQTTRCPWLLPTETPLFHFLLFDGHFSFSFFRLVYTELPILFLQVAIYI